MGETIEALVDAGKASAGPPLGPSLGPTGVNVKDVISEINSKTKEMAGMQVPVKIKIDKSGANTAAIAAYNKELGVTIEIRQCKYLNNIVEQDHRLVKEKTRTALGFKAFYSAHATLVGVELIQMIRKGQVRPIPGGSLI